MPTKFGALLLLLISTAVVARTEVRVGGYDFPPYVRADGTGITHRILQKINSMQSRYQLRFVSTSPKRRYKDCLDGRFELILFESLDWGWRGLPLFPSDIITQARDIFVGVQQAGRGQEYFSKLENKRLVARMGYHYKFAGFNPDISFLTRRFDIQLTHSLATSLKILLAGRGDLAVVTESEFVEFLHRHPEKKKQLLISQRVDHNYKLRGLLNVESSLSIQDVNSWIKYVKESGVFSDDFVNNEIIQ